MVIYDSEAIYIETATTIAGKIIKLDAIILALETEALNRAANEGISEYSLDDGQTKIKTVYRSTKDILNSIQSFIKMKEYYYNKLNGRVYRLTDGKSLKR